jgi:hypothetical protein
MNRRGTLRTGKQGEELFVAGFGFLALEGLKWAFPVPPLSGRKISFMVRGVGHCDGRRALCAQPSGKPD